MMRKARQGIRRVAAEFSQHVGSPFAALTGGQGVRYSKPREFVPKRYTVSINR